MHSATLKCIGVKYVPVASELQFVLRLTAREVFRDPSSSLLYLSPSGLFGGGALSLLEIEDLVRPVVMSKVSFTGIDHLKDRKDVNKWKSYICSV